VNETQIAANSVPPGGEPDPTPTPQPVMETTVGEDSQDVVKTPPAPATEISKTPDVVSVSDPMSSDAGNSNVSDVPTMIPPPAVVGGSTASPPVAAAPGGDASSQLGAVGVTDDLSNAGDSQSAPMWDGSEDLAILDPTRDMGDSVEMTSSNDAESFDSSPVSAGSTSAAEVYDVTDAATLADISAGAAAALDVPAGLPGESIADVYDVVPTGHPQYDTLGSTFQFAPTSDSTKPTDDASVRIRWNHRFEDMTDDRHDRQETRDAASLVETPNVESDKSQVNLSASAVMGNLAAEGGGFFARLWSAFRGLGSTTRRSDEREPVESKNSKRR